MVFQDYALFPHLSVADNIGFGLSALPRAERAQRVQQVLDLVGPGACRQACAAPVVGRPAAACGPGRGRWRRSPRLLLLDEPFSSLDVDLRERLAQEIRAILKESGTTALLVTHDQFEAFAVGDTIGVMNHGLLEQWDDAYTLYHRPVSRFVAEFIGHGVFAPAQIVNCAHGACVVTPLGEIHDVAGAPGAPLCRATCRWGDCDVLLRADDIVHDDASPIRALIERKAFRGSEFLLTLRLQTGERVMAHVPSHHDHHVGEWIGIRAEGRPRRDIPRLRAAA